MPLITRTEALRKGIPKKTIQTILLPRDKFSVRAAKRWLRENGYAWHYYRTTTNFNRFMQTPDIMDAIYYTKTLPNDVQIVMQEY